MYCVCAMLGCLPKTPAARCTVPGLAPFAGDILHDKKKRFIFRIDVLALAALFVIAGSTPKVCRCCVSEE